MKLIFILWEKNLDLKSNLILKKFKKIKKLKMFVQVVKVKIILKLYNMEKNIYVYFVKKNLKDQIKGK